MNDSLQSLQSMKVQGGGGSVTSTLLDVLIINNHPIMLGLWFALGLLLIISLYIFFEKFFTIHKYNSHNPALLKDLQDTIYRGNIDSALELCKKNKSIHAKILLRGVQKIGKPTKEIGEIIEDSAQLKYLYLEKNVVILAFISKAAPFLGILGAIINIIIPYFTTPSVLSIEAITLQSLIYIVIGLIIGLISYFFYCIIILKLKNTQYTFKLITIEFLDILNRPVPNL